MSSFKIGDVVYYNGDELEINSMSLMDIDNNLGKRTIKYIDKDEVGVLHPYSNNTITIVSLKDLLSEEDVNKRRDFLNEELKKVKEDILSKVRAAAELINQANVLAVGAGTELINIYEASNALGDIVDSVGWSSSSLIC